MTAVPPGQSLCVNGVPSTLTLPSKLRQCKPPRLYDVPFGLSLGAMGLPLRSTDAIIPVPLLGNEVGSGIPAAAGFHPSQYRKIPFRAVSVGTVVATRVRRFTNCLSNRAKKNVLFLTIGPP